MTEETDLKPFAPEDPGRERLRRGTSISGRRSRRDQSRWILGLGAVALLVIVVLPIGSLLIRSFLSEADGATFGNYVETLTNPTYFRALLTSLTLGIGVVALSTAFGVPMAWAVSRTDMPGKGLVRSLTALAYLTPTIFTSFAFVVLFAPNAGLANQALRWVGVENPPLNAFSLWTMILVISLNTFPFSFFLTSAAFESLDASYEEAGRMLGASRWKTTLRIAFPLAMPAILASALLSFVWAIGVFEAQAIIGFPARIFTLATRIYTLSTFPPEYGLAAALSMQLLVLTGIALYLHHKFLAGRGFASVGGKGVRPEPLTLGRLRYIPLLYCAVVLALALGSLLFLLVASLSKSWIRGVVPSNFTLEHYDYVLFELRSFWRAVRNSLVLAGGAATLTLILGLVVSYLDLRTMARGRKVLDHLSLIPLGLPGIVIAVAIVQAWLRLPIPILGTLTALMLAYWTRGLPIGVRSASAGLHQVDASLEEAARLSGSKWLRALGTITVPLMKNTLIAGWILVFVPLITEVSASILLFTNETITLGVVAYNLYENSHFEELSTVSILTLTITGLVLAAGWRLLSTTGGLFGITGDGKT